MGDITVLLVYGSWALAPVVAYQALMAGLNDKGRDLLGLVVVYAAAVVVTYLSVKAQVARNGFGPVAPMAVLVPALGTGVLSAVLYLLGRKAGRT